MKPGFGWAAPLGSTLLLAKLPVWGCCVSASAMLRDPYSKTALSARYATIVDAGARNRVARSRSV